MKTILISILLIFSSLFAHADALKALRLLPVQDGGRLKPLDTFARESLQMIYGRQTFKMPDAKGEPRPATEIIMTWMLQPAAWQDSPLFELNYGELKKSLKLPEDRKHFSFNELINNDRIPTLMQELQSKRETKEKLDPFFQALQRLESQLYTFREIAAGNIVRVFPPKEGDKWLSLAELGGEPQAKIVEITKAFVPYLAATTNGEDGEKLKEIEVQIQKPVEEFKALARAENPAAYPSDTRMNIELHYNQFHPFQYAWIVYLLGAVCCFLAWILGKQAFYKPAWALVILGMLLHVYGFALRVYIAGRPPVSNMYETVVWVGFGTVLFSVIIEAMYRWRFILLAGSLVGAFCLALADMAPVILDPSLQPLEPVLRNNFWLLVHVLTITISYAAFFLAFALGDIGLFYYLKDENKYRERLKAITLAIYRAMQIGISLLAPGIILGGIWADYSWGRFWGWDPKETWALIALLGYLAVLHGRLGGWIKDFGMVCCAIVTFSLVIMAWYGVNFVLGAGLHSYGFGAGGVEYVSVFVALHLLAVIFTSIVRFGRLKAQNPAV
jgi:ABC-type transport system involved in cytochrome c biogenesis permease subunit